MHLQAAGRAKGTVELRRTHLLRLADEMPSGPGEVDSDEIAMYLAGATWKPNTRRSAQTSIRLFFRWVFGSRRRDDDPTVDLLPVKAELGRPRPCPESAVRVAIMRAEPRERLMIALGASVGMRRAEIARCRSEHVTRTLDGWALYVLGKGHKVRYVPITDALAEMIQAAAPSGGWCFPSPLRGGPLTDAHVGKCIARVLPGNWTTHTLRHRFASAAYRADRDIRAVQELLGHASVATTQIYTAVPDDAKRRAAYAADIAA